MADVYDVDAERLSVAIYDTREITRGSCHGILQRALRVAHEAGEREMRERAAKACEDRELLIAKRAGTNAEGDAALGCADDIRALTTKP